MFPGVWTSKFFVGVLLGILIINIFERLIISYWKLWTIIFCFSIVRRKSVGVIDENDYNGSSFGFFLCRIPTQSSFFSHSVQEHITFYIIVIVFGRRLQIGVGKIFWIFLDVFTWYTLHISRYLEDNDRTKQWLSFLLFIDKKKFVLQISKRSLNDISQ